MRCETKMKTEKEYKEIMDDKTLNPLEKRQKFVGGTIEDEGNGYFSLVGCGGFSNIVAYIMLPKGHPDCNKDYDKLDPNVNGGLTYGDGRVYGWDYGHFQNYGTPSEDIKNALKYFRKREKKKV